MSTPKNAPYKLRQREQHYATIYDHAKNRLQLRAGPATVTTRGGRRYVIDPETGQWWRAEKWVGRPAVAR